MLEFSDLPSHPKKQNLKDEGKEDVEAFPHERDLSCVLKVKGHSQANLSTETEMKKKRM